MARQIIVLERTGPGNEIQFRAAFWLAVPVARQPLLANAAAVSAVKDASVTAPELAAIQTGAVVEQTDTFRFASGTALAVIEAALQAEFTARQAALTADNRYARYGSSFDGTVWTVQNIT